VLKSCLVQCPSPSLRPCPWCTGNRQRGQALAFFDDSRLVEQCLGGRSCAQLLLSTKTWLSNWPARCWKVGAIPWDWWSPPAPARCDSRSPARRKGPAEGQALTPTAWGPKAGRSAVNLRHNWLFSPPQTTHAAADPDAMANQTPQSRARKGGRAFDIKLLPRPPKGKKRRTICLPGAAGAVLD